MRGGEKVIESMLDIFPQSNIITNVYNQNEISDKIRNCNIETTFIDSLPFSSKYYQYYLPLYPSALNRKKIDDVDVVISSESGPAKGINISNKIPHICYTHTPMRYIWDMQEDYFGTGLKRKIVQPLIDYLQNWDYQSAQKIDYIVANSKYVSNRIEPFGVENQLLLTPRLKQKILY